MTEAYAKNMSCGREYVGAAVTKRPNSELMAWAYKYLCVTFSSYSS